MNGNTSFDRECYRTEHSSHLKNRTMGSIKTHMLLPRAHKIFGYPTQTPSEQPRNTIYRQSENICPYVKTGCAPLKQPQLVQKGTTPRRFTVSKRESRENTKRERGAQSMNPSSVNRKSFPKSNDEYKEFLLNKLQVVKNYEKTVPKLKRSMKVEGSGVTNNFSQISGATNSQAYLDNKNNNRKNFMQRTQTSEGMRIHTNSFRTLPKSSRKKAKEEEEGPLGHKLFGVGKAKTNGEKNERNEKLVGAITKYSLKPFSLALGSTQNCYRVKSDTRLKGSSIDDYEIQRLIGQGAYAEVKEAWVNQIHDKVALKIYDKYKLIDPQKKKNVIREIKVLELIHHENIIELYDVMDTNRQVILATELVKGKSLRSIIKSNANHKFSEKDTKNIFRQIADALAYLHNKNICHRDLKLDNILLGEHQQVKIIDFGFSIFTKKDSKLHMFCGTPSYMSPEIINKKQYLGPPSDMWAAGVCLYVLLTGIFPFRSNVNRELYRRISRGIFSVPETLPKAAQNLIYSLLQIDPEKRLTAKEVLNHEYLSESGRREIMEKPENIEGYDAQIIKNIINLGYKIEYITEQLGNKNSYVSVLYNRLSQTKQGKNIQ